MLSIIPNPSYQCSLYFLLDFLLDLDYCCYNYYYCYWL